MFLVFWGAGYASNPSSVVSTQQELFQILAGSGYNGLLTQYYDANGGISNDVILGGSWTDYSGPSGSVTQPSEVAEVNRAISVNAWSSASGNNQFVLLPQPGSSYNDPISQNGWCAYHASSSGVVYSVIPYMGDSGYGFPGCNSAFGNGNIALAMTSLSSHEYAESETDPFGNAWLDQTGVWEIGDMCEPLWAVFGAVSAQDLWSNQSNSCVAPGSPGSGATRGSANLLRNASFEASGFANWSQWNGSINVGSGTPGLDDGYYLISNTSSPGDSFYQDVSTSIDTSHDYTFSIWARSGTSGNVSGTIALWPDEASADSSETNFVVGPKWQLISTTINPANFHSSIRAQVYLATTGTNFNFDGAQLVPSLLRNASFEASGFANWHQWNGSINVGSGTPGLDDGYYLISNTSSPGDSFYQDVSTSIDASHDYTFSIWARSGTSGNVSGTIALWPDEASADSSETNFVVGPNWQLISTTINPANFHSSIRAQVYLATTGTNFNFDGAQLDG